MKLLTIILWLVVALAAARTCDQRPNSPIGTCAFVGGEFSNARPRSGADSAYQWICYAGFDTTASCAQIPSSYQQYCNCQPAQTSLIGTYPVQLRWGIPVNAQIVAYPSGFGWRGAQGVAVPQPGQLFYLGEAAHFNYVIAASVTVSTWTMTMVVTFDVPGRPEQTVRFALDLEMDETSNSCTGSGCENAAFWGNKGPNDPDIWPACLNCGASQSYIVRRLNSCDKSSDSCCPYVTLSAYTIDPPGPDNSYYAGGPCSDRVWTLTRFAQSVPIDIGDGFEYTVSFAGFTAPGSPQTPVDYFISQENRQTPAEIWGSLVRNCPSTASCPSPAVLQLNEAGDACICKCPSTYTCPAGQELDATCQCVCKDTGECGPCGKPVLSGNSCQCQCNTDPSCCGAGSLQVASGSECQCSCPADVCTPPKTLSDPNAITCPCRCPDCTGRQVLVDGDTCRCACPATACAAPKVLSDPNDPSCPCACPTTTCANTNHVVDPSTCNCACPSPIPACTSPKEWNPKTCKCECPVGCPGGQIRPSDCGGGSDGDSECSLPYAATDRPCVEFTCQGDNATCVASLVAEATCSLDLVTLIPADHDPQCYVSQCAEDRGDGKPGCIAAPADGTACQAAGTENYDEVCYSSVCSGGKCVVKMHDDDPCALAQVPQCHVAQCEAGTCSAVMDPTKTCAVDLSVYGDSAQCYASECVEAEGGCAAVFQEGNNCTVKGLAAVVGAANVPCYTAVCTGDKCAPTARPDGTRCFEPVGAPPEGGDEQCYVPYCMAGTCGWSPAPGLSCDDYDPCSLALNTTDPVSGLPSDVCVADPDNSTVVVCRGTANTCEADRLAQENETMTRCLETESQEQCEKQLRDKLREKLNCTQICQPVSNSYYCLDPCAVKASGHQNDAVAIALGTIGGVCVFGLAGIVLIFAYVKWGHKYLVGLFNGDAQIAAAQDSPLYAAAGGAGTSQLYEGSA